MEQLKILLVDDDLKFGQLIVMGLHNMGYKVHFQTSLAGVEDAISKFNPSVILLDVEIGEENGMEKAKDLLLLFPSIPIIFVSSHVESSFVVEGISAGGSLYLKKPFDIEELDAYIRRFSRDQKTTDKISFGNYQLNTCSNELYYGNNSIAKLTPLERNALLLFLKNKNSPISSALFAMNLWGENNPLNVDQNIYNIISKLRKYLNKDNQVQIKTIKGAGYQLTI